MRSSAMVLEPKAKKARASQQEAAEVFTHACADVIRFKLLEGCTPAELEAEIEQGGLEFEGEFFNQVSITACHPCATHKS